MRYYAFDKRDAKVSPHPRGVDRNDTGRNMSELALVSPHPRGVDRNCSTKSLIVMVFCLPSPEGSG